MSDHLESVVKEALGHYGERITRVEAHLTDANGATKAGPDDIRCTLEARPVGHEPVVAKDRAGTAHQAIQGALWSGRPPKDVRLVVAVFLLVCWPITAAKTSVGD